MAQKMPNSDRSKRAGARAAERQARSAEPQGPKITWEGLFARVGALTVEKDYWQEQAKAATAEVDRLQGLYEGDEEPEDAKPTEVAEAEEAKGETSTDDVVRSVTPKEGEELMAEVDRLPDVGG